MNISAWAKIFIARIEKKLIENVLGAITGCVCCFLNYMYSDERQLA